VAKTFDDQPKPSMKERVSKLNGSVQGSQAWNSIFRPGSIFRKGYTDSPRNRSYVIMNNVLYHLHPVKVKRHAVKVSYTLCLGGLSFFLFILLTVTGIFLMFFYRPTDVAAWNDISNLQIGDVVRAGELTIPEGVELVDDPEMAIITALAGRIEVEPEPTEGEEGEEGETAEGAAAAESSDAE